MKTNIFFGYSLCAKFVNLIYNHLMKREYLHIGRGWKPYMDNLDTLLTDATCYESRMRFPTDAKLLWECIEKSYGTMCEISKALCIHRPRTKMRENRLDIHG
jgi:hypothetical protein